MSPIYTGKGDDGYTGLLGEERVPKYHPRTEAVGTLDEATAALGVARSISHSSDTHELIKTIQRDLYGMMAEISATGDNVARFQFIDADRVGWLEDMTNNISSKVEMPKEFILPGDTPSGASVGLARTVVRRAERRVSELIHSGVVENGELLRYLNRLSSLCFVLELWENQLAGKASPTLAKEDPHR
jgi:cob(I)alamin adenosyltransferase